MRGFELKLADFVMVAHSPLVLSVVENTTHQETALRPKWELFLSRYPGQNSEDTAIPLLATILSQFRNDSRHG